MKFFTILFLIFSFNLYANDYTVICKPWKANPQNFSLKADVEITGGSYVDAWVSLKVFEEEEEIHSTQNTFSFGLFAIDMLNGKRVILFELRPAGGQSYQYDFLKLAADHPYPTGNSYLIHNGKEYQAECITH